MSHTIERISNAPSGKETEVVFQDIQIELYKRAARTLLGLGKLFYSTKDPTQFALGSRIALQATFSNKTAILQANIVQEARSVNGLPLRIEKLMMSAEYDGIESWVTLHNGYPTNHKDPFVQSVLSSHVEIFHDAMSNDNVSIATYRGDKITTLS